MLIPACGQQPVEAQLESGHAVELRQVRRPQRSESHVTPQISRETELLGNTRVHEKKGDGWLIHCGYWQA